MHSLLFSPSPHSSTYPFLTQIHVKYQKSLPFPNTHTTYTPGYTFLSEPPMHLHHILSPSHTPTHTHTHTDICFKQSNHNQELPSTPSPSLPEQLLIFP